LVFKEDKDKSNWNDDMSKNSNKAAGETLFHQRPTQDSDFVGT